MKKLIILFATLSMAFSWQNCHEESGWCFEQSTLQAFYLFETARVDGNLAEGDDVIGAFCNGNMVGWFAAAESFTMVPAMGNDGSFPGYCNGGDVPSFQIYDASNGSYLDAVVDGDVPGWETSAINQLAAIDVSNTFGCTDDSACNYNSDATADDGSCVDFDCAGVCGGSAVVDDCDVCDGGNADQDCAGVCFGSSVDTWCDGSCGETGPVDDGCGVCGGDDSSCTGCTDPLADNYDSGNLFEDGTCEYTVPGVSDLSAVAGPARVILSWSAPAPMGEASYSYDVLDGDGNFVRNVVSTSTQILNLAADVEACFSVVAVNSYGSSDASAEACATPFEAAGMTWGFQVTASINGYGAFDESDAENFFGVSGDATNEFDNDYDIPEPPASVGNYIQFYFPHVSDWAHPWDTDNFTQDVRLEDDEYFSHNLIVWSGELYSNMDGDATVSFDDINGAYPGYPIYALLDGSYHSVSDGTVLGTFLNANQSKGIDIILGNIVPQAPDGLGSAGGDRSISLEWTADGSDLSDIGDRYPATSYNVYRDNVLISTSGETSHVDDADMEGHAGQGLLYESSYDYTVTGNNAAGESFAGHTVTYSDNSSTFFSGRASYTSSTTDDNIDPVASAVNVDSDEGSNGHYEIPHDGSPAENPITINADGSGSGDADEFDSISRFTWTQTDGPSDISLNGADSDDLSFSASNPHDGSAKTYSFNLLVEADYPVKGGIATRSDNAQVSVTVDPEPNDGPNAEVDVIYGVDYDAITMLWTVPHDGTPVTTTAEVGVRGTESSDPDGDNFTYLWNTYGDCFDAECGEQWTDLNGNGTWDNNEPFIDLDGDETWDGYDPHTSETVIVARTAGVYNFTVTVTDSYGYTDTQNMIVLVHPEPNDGPSADAGSDQVHYLEPDVDCYDTSVDGTISDPEEDDLSNHNWSDGGALDHDVCLGVGSHDLTLCVTDPYGANSCDTMNISVLHEPTPAVPGGLTTTHSLYYIELDWNSSDDQNAYGDNAHVYGMNAVSYNVYRDGALLVNISADNDGSEYRLDNGLDPSTQYCYSVSGINSHGHEGDASSDVCDSTGDRPTVTVTSPNGAEIWSVGDPYPVTWDLTDDQYISNITIHYSDERQAETVETSFSGDTGAGSAGLSTSSATLEGHADEVSDVYEEASIRISITDIGDYYGNNTAGSDDASDNAFTMSAHDLTREVAGGWHLFGSALDPYANTMDENLSPDLGDWGSGWVAYDQDGNYTDLELTLGQGYFLAATAFLEEVESLTLSGDVVTSDDFSRADLAINGGWTLISDPLVVGVNKNNFTVTTGGETYSWSDAISFGFVSPSVYGWDNGYIDVQNIEKFQGYWVHSSRSLDLHVRPHLDDLSRMTDNDGWKLSLRASDENGIAGSDLVTIGLSEDATNDFKYGEDEFDLPDPAIDSYVDLFVKNIDWLGNEDINGNVVESPYFTADIRAIPDMDDAQVWNVSGVAHNLTGDVELTWDMDELEEAYNVYLVVNGDAFDMREESSIMVSQDDLTDMTVLVGSGNLGFDGVDIPEEFSFNAAYPNPFNPVTNMTLALDADGQVTMMVYNLIGQVVDVLVDGHMTAGYHNVTWDAGNIPSGVYIVKVHTGSHTSTQKVMLMK